MFSFFALDSLPFLFPAELLLWNCGSGREEEPSGEEAVLRQIQIRLATPVWNNRVSVSRQFVVGANRRFQFHKRS